MKIEEERPLESALGIPPGYILGLSREYPNVRIAHLYDPCRICWRRAKALKDGVPARTAA